MGSRRGPGTELLILRQPVFFHFRRTIFVWPPVNHRLGLKVPVRRRRGGDPFQSIRLPWISFGLLSCKQAPEEINQEENLRGAEDQRADGNENIPMLHRLQELILSRVIDPPHMTGDAEKVHREKGAVKENIREYKMNLT